MISCRPGDRAWVAAVADAGFVRDIVVVPGKDGPNEPFGYEFAANWWVPNDYIATAGESVHDWAIVALASRRLGSAAGWFRLSALSTATLTDPSFVPAVFGYPADRPEGTLWGTVSAGFTTVSGEELTYEIDTSPGESGAPIFSLGNADGRAGNLVGIHRFGSPDAGPNGGSRIDDRFIADLIDACETMGCTIEAYREG
jgi:V8-like Glu-specific endopeptidase